jgi:hypothetical protein
MYVYMYVCMCRASIYPYYESIGKYCGYVSKALKLTKSCTMNFRYSSLGELFHTTGTPTYTYIHVYADVVVAQLCIFHDRVGESMVF